MSMRSKTQWEGNQLVTKSNVETPMGRMEIEEVRSLSADGNEMTVELTRQGRTQKLVYRNSETRAF
jgi:hypothetical protein